MSNQALMLSIRRAKWIAKAKEFIFYNINTWNRELEILQTRTLNKFPEMLGYPTRRKLHRVHRTKPSWLRLSSKGLEPPNNRSKKGDKR
jgi:hypothetical protein